MHIHPMGIYYLLNALRLGTGMGLTSGRRVLAFTCIVLPERWGLPSHYVSVLPPLFGTHALVEFAFFIYPADFLVCYYSHGLSKTTPA